MVSKHPTPDVAADIDTSRNPGHFKIAGREFPNITWYKRRNLRTLYFCMCFVILTSATNGYDGSMVNGLLTLNQFKDCTSMLSNVNLS